MYLLNTSSLSDQITAKHLDGVKLAQCCRLFFENRNEFRFRCSNFSKSHLTAYICMFCERYDSIISADLLFDVDCILIWLLTKGDLIKENNVVDELLDILSLTILISEEESMDVLKDFMTDLTFADNECEALSVVEVILKIHPEIVTFAVKTSIAKMVFSDTQVVEYMSLRLVRQMVESDNNPALVDEIIREIEKNETTKRLQSLKVLCILIDCDSFRKKIITTSSCWIYLQQALLSSNRSAFKYALYIMRKIIDYHSSCLEETFLSGSEVLSQWENFFLIQETLDEKQSHLILPVLEFLPKTKSLPMNWYYVLMIQILRHENTQVLQYGLVYAINNIKLDAKSITCDELINEFFTSFMNGLNNAFLYTKTNFPIGGLKDLFEPIIEIALEKFLAINWKAVPMYCIIDAMANSIFQQNKHHNQQVAEKFLKILRLVNKVPNVHIRKGIQSLIRLSVINIAGHINVETFTELASIYSMKDFVLLEFDYWSQEDIVAVLDHKNLDDTVKRTFLHMLEITDEVMLDLLKSMRMKNFINFNIFETLASRHFYSLNIWLRQALMDTTVEPTMFLSMYSVLFNINDSQHCQEIVEKIPEPSVLLNTLKLSDVANSEHLCQIIYSIFILYYEDLPYLLTVLIDCGTVQTTLLALNIIKEHKRFLTRDILIRISVIVQDLQNVAVVERFVEIAHINIKFLHVETVLFKFYTQLIQTASNNNHLLAAVVDRLLQEPDDFLVLCSKHIQNLLTYGTPLKGDQRVEYDLSQIIYKNDPQSEWVESSLIRYKILNKLIDFPKILSNDLTDYLFKFSADLNLNKPRYFADSLQHRTKLRLVQALAMLLSRNPIWDSRLQTALLNENNQPNVTFILELMIGRTIGEEQLSILSKEAKSNSARQSVFVIMYYVCLRKRDPILACNLMDDILPFTMGQHFNTRLFAQITIVKLIEKFGINTPGHKYSLVYDQIKHSFDQGNAKQISEKFLQDFRFKCIDGDNLLNHFNILYEIPRVTQMAKDEMIPEACFSKYENVQHFQEPFHVNSNMCGAHNENVDYGGNENVQKKIIPTKNICPDVSLLETLPNYSSIVKESNEDGLIVIASLISRSPNLGGLSRSCEIFGVQQLVLHSLKQIENKEFQSLSMTSEKWLNIGEVKSWQLFDYLVLMKSKGYCIIGAEQTANGKNLSDFSFPKKSVLLLGHEQSGIAANLLSVLDVAVEIPQVGIVRSLNVHVSGAIFVWEYAKQHNLS